MTRPASHLPSLGYWVVFVFGVAVLEAQVLAADGPVKEVMLPEGLSSAQSIAVDRTGRIWFTEKIGKKLVLFESSTGEFTTYSLPSSWGNVGFSRFALGSDGEIWFTVRRWAENAEEPHFFGKFTPDDGFFSKYVLSIDSVPEELLVDGEGVMWFTASNKNTLYRADLTDFSVTGYPVPTSNGYPRGLAVDEIGQIWFAEPNANKIGKFVPGKALFHEYEIPTAFANPGEIAIDKDGRVWFVEMHANRIAVFYPDWVRFDEAIIPTPRSSPGSIVIDSKGNVWFLEYRGNKVGVFTPETAVFREYAIPTFNSLPGALAIDRERSVLWFSEGNTEAKRLGVLSIDEALAEPERKDTETNEASSGRTLLEERSPKTWSQPLLLLISVAFIVVAAGWLRYSRAPRKGTAT